MTYKEYQGNHEEERKDTDGCEGCKYEYVQPWARPCLTCKRNAKDLYERRTDEHI